MGANGWPPFFSSTALNLLSMEFTRASKVATGVLFHSSMSTSRSWWMLESLRSSTFHLRMPHSLTLPSASLARQWSEVCLGSFSCWNTALQLSRREGIMLCFSTSQYMLAFMVPSMNCSSPVPAALMPHLMQCAAHGLSTDRLTPHPFNFCNNAGSTHTSISQTQPLDMTLSMCTQLLWSTMARPVLSGTCPVKPLYGLGSVSGSSPFSYSLRLLYVEQQFFFSDPQRVLYHEVPCWTSSDQYERVRAITPNLTHLLPIHIWDLVTLTSHMTPGRENG